VPAISRFLPIGPALCLGAFVVAADAAQSLPDGRGRAEFEALCLRCHGVEQSTKRRMTQEQWAAVVDEMLARGTETTTEDQRNRVVEFLATNFGPKPATPPKVDVNSARPAELVEALGLAAGDAEAIVRHRESQGPFKEWSDLKKVQGIDIEKLEAQKDRIEFSGPKAAADEGRG
jgi:competence ComEA-like helix-hairpin-helix protein